MTLTVEIFSDVICPWCYIGKRRLEKAIRTFGGFHDVRVHWLPFQLNPEMPKAGVARSVYRMRKFGSLERGRELDANVVKAGVSDGIHFAFEQIERTPNTLDAHRLIWLADQQGIQDHLVEGLFRAYFTEGRDISRRETLSDIAAEAGLDRQLIHSCLSSDEGMKEIDEVSQRSVRLGITGVPFLIINQELMFSGAQPPETFVAAFQHAIASQ